MQRREFLTAAGIAGLTATVARPVGATELTARYQVGVCDWMMLKRQKLGAIALAAEIGADGVEVDMGSLGARPTFENRLADPAVRGRFLEASERVPSSAI